ncbi:TPA: hypothetical protein DDZ01_04180 [Candidatus Uhrbacteria bacterium]|nr:MAG: hypothetical protein UT94_C0016G0002 [Candidatus Uhrbacteria bacterium GW2011_GWF2_40_263]OGL98201.1 MAG: hypothetical protein A2332_03790 [Candidatus Uhrbacteria bacterium RIFOXYB2_FULL_41_18]HBK35161.1 hypothetical protein [Candidatus Uhrbacteria bacterium]HCB56053.1 hypothetical protein [Candidatus Uhrbacteria bacterium]
MLSAFKQFGEKATESFSHLFDKTRIALTLVYVIILAVILLASGGMSRYVFTERLSIRFEPMNNGLEIIERREPHIPNMKNIQSDFQDTLFL